VLRLCPPYCRWPPPGDHKIRKKASGVTMAVPACCASESKSLSRVTRKSAAAATAQATILSSFGSHDPAGGRDADDRGKSRQVPAIRLNIRIGIRVTPPDALPRQQDARRFAENICGKVEAERPFAGKPEQVVGMRRRQMASATR
jgi:hypothetical protein